MAANILLTVEDFEEPRLLLLLGLSVVFDSDIVDKNLATLHYTQVVSMAVVL
jgi:hypothetical protein